MTRRPVSRAFSTDAGLTALLVSRFVVIGYGEVTPKSSSARNLAILEALIGQLFYLVILIARLVSQRAPGEQDGGPPP